MAKAVKKSTPKKKASKPKKLSRSNLVTNTAAAAHADVQVLFNSGLGQLTATLFRNGVLINMQSISTSGSINFTDVQSRDVISINGVCAGTARITITVPTRPATPENFGAGIIMAGYLIQ